MKVFKMKGLCLFFMFMLISCSAEKHQDEWVIKNGEKYYYNHDGKMVKDYEMAFSNGTYYFDKSGRMQRGIQIVNGETRYYGKDGKWTGKSEWIKEGNDYYYFELGIMKTGWTQDEHLDYWYYLKPDGKMAKSQWIDSIYYVDENGRMLSSKDDNMMPVVIDNKKYFVDKEGRIVNEDSYELTIKNNYVVKYKSKYATEYANYEYSIDKLFRDGDLLGAKTKLEQYKKLVDKYDYDMIENITMSNYSKYDSIVNDNNKAFQFIKDYKKKLGY